MFDRPRMIDCPNSHYSLTAHLDRLVPRWLKRYGIPGTALALVRQGRLVWARGYGLANREMQIAMTPDSVFQVASISKSAAAWGVMKLVENGKLDLDTPVEAYLPGWRFPPAAYNPSEVTIRRLLSHTAGINQPEYPGYLPGERLPGLEDSLRGKIQPQRGIKIERRPGSKFVYTDGDYALLQWLIERITGEDFPSFIRRVVLEPLGMISSRFDASPHLLERMATGYDARGRSMPRYQFVEKAPIGLHTTAVDLANFIAAWMPGPNGEPTGRGVLSPASVELLFTPTITIPGFERWIYADEYGLGYFLETSADGRKMISHLGGYLGWRSEIVANPGSGEGIVILTNSDLGHELFADVLNAWTTWLGIGPLRVAQVISLGRICLRLVSLGLGIYSMYDTINGELSPSRKPYKTALALIDLVGLSSFWIIIRPILQADLPSVSRWLTVSVTLFGLARLVRLFARNKSR